VLTKPATVGAVAAARRAKRPRIGLLGPLIGRNAGRVTTQGEILADLLESHGYGVVRASSRPNRYGRLMDILWTVFSRNRDVDVLLIQTFGGPSFVVEDAASWLGHWFGKPMIFQLHGGAMPQFLQQHPWWGRRVLSRADQLVVPSAYLARALKEHNLHARIVPNIVDVASYPFRVRHQVRPRLMWMRAFHPIYHPEMAVRVLARLRAVMPEATLVMGGEEKGLGESTRQLAVALSVADAIRFVGFLDAAAKHREGDSADIFLNTNRIDNQPVSVIEACAMGLPVVATAVGGVPDLLADGETGLLVPDGDDAAMAEAILRLLREPALSARLSVNGRELARRFAPECALAEWRGVLDEVGGVESGGN
jgi:glycosyltransferase involved in cell wall biosynthesis